MMIQFWKRIRHPTLVFRKYSTIHTSGTFLDMIRFLEEELGKTGFLHYYTCCFNKFNNPTMFSLESAFFKIVSFKWKILGRWFSEISESRRKYRELKRQQKPKDKFRTKPGNKVSPPNSKWRTNQQPQHLNAHMHHCRRKQKDATRCITTHLRTGVAQNS